MTKQEAEQMVRNEQLWFVGQIELLRNHAARLGDTRLETTLNALLVRARARASGKDPADIKQLKPKRK